MRWTEIVDYAAADGYTLPTYRQMDLWTRQGLLTAEMRGDRHGQYRDWPDGEVEAALTVARLLTVGMDCRLAFQVARSEPDGDGGRALILDGGNQPLIRVEVRHTEDEE